MNHELNPGDRFMLEFEVKETTRLKEALRATTGDGKEYFFYAGTLQHAKPMRPAVPEPRIPEIKVGQKWVTRGGETVTIISDDGTSAYPFRYKTKWGSTRLVTRECWHSAGQPDDDDLMRIVEAPEPQKLDTSKPMRLLGSDEASFTFLQRATNGMLIIKWDSGSLDVLAENEVENIPAPKIKGRREVVLLDDGFVHWIEECGLRENDEYIGEAPTTPFVRFTEAQAIEQERDALKARLALAEELLQGWSGEVDIPDRNCSCHISPPCGDCVTYGGLRDLDEQTTRFLEAK
jgi:hypothetical protein